MAVSFGLIMALAGETVGMLEDWRRSLMAVWVSGTADPQCLSDWQLAVYVFLAGDGRRYDGVRSHLCPALYAPDECPGGSTNAAGRTRNGQPTTGRICPASRNVSRWKRNGSGWPGNYTIRWPKVWRALFCNWKRWKRIWKKAAWMMRL